MIRLTPDATKKGELDAALWPGPMPVCNLDLVLLKHYDDFMRLIQPKATIPHAVVGLVVRKGFSLPRAWRDHLGLTQTEVAGRMGITQAALSQLEASGRKLRKQTVITLAVALNLQPDQLSE